MVIIFPSARVLFSLTITARYVYNKCKCQVTKVHGQYLVSSNNIFKNLRCSKIAIQMSVVMKCSGHPCGWGTLHSYSRQRCLLTVRWSQTIDVTLSIVLFLWEDDLSSKGSYSIKEGDKSILTPTRAQGCVQQGRGSLGAPAV